MSGGSSKASLYHQPIPSKKKNELPKPKRIEVDSQGKKWYVYDCPNCLNEFRSKSPRKYKSTFCGEKCRREAFGKIGSSKKGVPRTEEDRKSIGVGRKKAWDSEKRNNPAKWSQKKPRKKSEKKYERKSKFARVCPQCGNAFKTPEKNQKYCSQKCCGHSQRKGKYHTCANPNCDNKFYRKPSKEERKYCSMDCAKTDPNYWKSVADTKKERYGRNWEWKGWEEKRTDRLIWEPIAAMMRQLDQQRCQSCNRDWKRGEKQFPVHHIIPWSQGGPDEEWNLILLCPKCHRKTDAQGGPVRFPNPYQETLI